MIINLNLQFFGGRGGSSGSSRSSGAAYGETITINGYTIKGGYVKSPKGGYGKVSSFRELSSSELAQAKKFGVDDPVLSESFLLPRKVAQAAIGQRESEANMLKKNVPGLDELRRARDYDSQQRSAFRSSIYRGDGLIRGNGNSNTAAAVEKKYPRAVAYLKAESYTFSSNYRKSAAGRQAMNEIASGKSYKKALKKMEEEWSKAASEHMWD